MKTTIILTPCDDFEHEAIVSAVKNKLKLDCLYDEVFRPVIKYSNDYKEIAAYELVWAKVQEYLGEE